MLPLFRILALVACLELLAVPTFAAEPQDAEVLLEKLNALESPKSRSLAKRWEGLIRMRQWKSASGKHTTYAKYVDHAPDLSSIKLLVLVPGGEERTEKLVDVPLDKLDKNAQALLKRIAKAREAIIKFVGEAETTSDEPSSVREREYEDDEGVAEVRGGPDEDPVPRRRRGAAKNISRRPVTFKGKELPDLNTPNFPDKALWRTSHDAFIKNLSARQLDPKGDVSDISNWQLNWGKLQDLRWQWEYIMLEISARSGQLTREQSLEAKKKSDESEPRVGEIMWTGTLKRDLPSQAGTGVEFDFPSPPVPFNIVFFLDEDFLGSAKPLKKGQRVSFIGRFKSFGLGTPAIIIHVRIPDEQPVNDDSEREAEPAHPIDRGLPPGVEETLPENAFSEE